jgi:hypothetical protein
MNKVVSIFLLIVFLFTNSGIAINIRWCGDKINSVKFFANGPHKSICDKKTRCCKDLTTILKANKDLAKTSQNIFKTGSSEFIKITLIHRGSFNLDFRCCCANFYHPPPITKSNVPIYLLDRVFLI